MLHVVPSQVRTAVVRTGKDVSKCPINGFLRAGDVVMGFEAEDGPSHPPPIPLCSELVGCADTNTPRNLRCPLLGTAVGALRRIRVKRVSAGKLSARAVLQGWTSVETYGGDGILQEFDLFNEEGYEMGVRAASITGGAMSGASPARVDSVGSGGSVDRLGDGLGSGGSR